MEITEIIKDSFTFPVNNLKALGIYIAFTLAAGIVIGLAAVCTQFSVNNAALLIVSFLLLIVSLLIGFILAGYEIDIIKTGIDFEEIAPSIDIKNDLVRGIKAIIVAIVYYIIPAIITIIVAALTNLPQNMINVAQNLNQTIANTNGTVVVSSAIDMVPKELIANLAGSITLTVLVGIVLFIIFSFFHYMANARLANTDSLGEALNIPEAFRDLSRIGFGKVIATVLLLIIIVVVITAILGYIYQYIPALTILNIIVSPFLMFAMNRANGLLYSDIV